jgi:sporulation protein YlmC with PRC-barrel domain
MANNPTRESGTDRMRDPSLGTSGTNTGFGSAAGSTGSASGEYSGSSAGGSSAAGARIQGSGAYENTSGPGPRLMTASTLEGDRVVNRQGEDLGEIDEIMLDVPRGRIAYAVMSSGGFLGMGDKLFAIPWSALILDTDNKCFVLDVDKQRLENAPGFDKDNWPNTADADFDARVHSYYGARPYWE